ncbi:hypothetical protein ACLMJK_002924 [Lecanora helva]
MIAPPSSPSRVKATYAIPQTSLNLNLVLGLDLPLPFASIHSCLTGAISVASDHNPNSPIPATVLHFQHPRSSSDSGASFAIVGDPVFGTDELHWRDVVETLRGLKEWIEGRQERGEPCVELWYRVVEGGGEGRGEIGNGFVRKREGDNGKALNERVETGD